MKNRDFIFWFDYEGTEDFVIISARTEGEACEIFDLQYGIRPIIECHEVVKTPHSMQYC